MRKLWLGIIGLAAASTVQASVVTFTLSLHEGTNGLSATTNSYAVYATVSNDNSGLFAYGVDLTGTGDAGGPTVLALANRTPSGTWDANPSDVNFDPSNTYPTMFGGFGAGRSTSTVTGIVSGVQDLSKDVNLVRAYGVGQTAHKMDDFRPPPDTTGNPDASPVAYGPYVASAGSDGGATPYGNPATPSATVIPGSIRIATGTWTGTAPSIQQLSVNTKASVWKLSHPAGTENEIATLQFALRDLQVVTNTNEVTLSGTLTPPNVATGGAIVVTGANGLYSSEVDQLTTDAVVKGGAPIQTIGDEAGNVYIMLKLNGSAADIAAVNAEPNAVGASDSQFALLHAQYDSLFGVGGFNALFKYANITGPKNVNFDFSGTAHGPVTVDEIAAVPEPATMGLMAFAGLGLLARRRRHA